MKVMLMVEREGRVVSVGAVGGHCKSTENVGRWACSARHERIITAASHWWLVEAESAEEARAAIGMVRMNPTHQGDIVLDASDGAPHVCRILASGGRS